MIPLFLGLRTRRWALLGCAAMLGMFAGAGPAWAQEESYKPGSPKPAQKDKKTTREEGKSLFGGGKDKPGERVAGQSTWSIVITAFRGDDQDADARAGLETVRVRAGLTDAYAEKRGEAMVIAYGRYDDPTSKQAKADLERVRGVQVTIDGTPQKVFRLAFLAPPVEIHGTRPEYDLRTALKQNGDWALYSLQVGVYSREDRKAASPSDLAEFRKMAEQAVVKLRSEGELAFYYHGPSRSMVTIGLWGVGDYDEALHADKNAGLHALRQRFPYNLQNGMGIKQRLKVTDPKTGQQAVKEKLQPSNLVAVPKE